MIRWGKNAVSFLAGAAVVTGMAVAATFAGLYTLDELGLEAYMGEELEVTNSAGETVGMSRFEAWKDAIGGTIVKGYNLVAGFLAEHLPESVVQTASAITGVISDAFSWVGNTISEIWTTPDDSGQSLQSRAIGEYEHGKIDKIGTSIVAGTGAVAGHTLEKAFNSSPARSFRQRVSQSLSNTLSR